MSIKNRAYWDDLAEDLRDPEFLREFVLESMRIHMVDSLINELDDAREIAGLSKAELARSISINPATVRRLLGSATHSNPTLQTVSELAAALGYRLKLERFRSPSAQLMSDALRRGCVDDPKALVEAAEEWSTSEDLAHIGAALRTRR